MAIKLTPSTNIVSPLEQLHTKDTVPAVIGSVVASASCCFCDCDLCLPAIADLSTNDEFKNDFYSFIISAPTTSTVTGTLIKIAQDGSETEIVITDQTYGDFFALGSARADVWAFKLLWKNVATLQGFGRYRFNIKTVQTAKVIFEMDTPCFELAPWSCEAEHETVRIEVSQKGYIEDGFDFRGLTFITPGPSEGVPRTEWIQQIRLYGMLNRTFVTETDTIPDTDRRERQIQTRNYRNWNLKLNWMPGIITEFVVNEMMLANPILLSDFNQFNVEKYRNQETKFLSVEDPEKGLYDDNEFYNIKLEDYRKATIKRHG